MKKTVKGHKQGGGALDFRVFIVCAFRLTNFVTVWFDFHFNTGKT